ncbi:MAG: MFS transporter [Deltaproteobacteria bacterium]|nr:MFS transporter [Deltaproteobacteria bacterium]
MTGARPGSLALLYSTVLLMSLGHGMVFPTIPLLAASFGVSAGLAVQVVTAHALGRTVVLIPAGLLIDRYGAKAAMLAGSALVLCGAFTTAVTPWFVLLFLGQFLAGVGDSVWSMAREVSGVEMVEQRQRGRLLSGFMGVKSAGTAIGPVLGGIVAQWVGFRAVFLSYAGAAALVLVTALLARRDTVRGRVGKIAWWGKVSDVLPHLRATFVVLVIATFSMQMYRTTLQGMLPLFAGVELGFSAAQVGSLFGVSGLFVLLMILPAGFITDRVGRKYASVPSTALPGIAFLALPFAATLPQLVAIMVLIGLAQGMSLGALSVSTYDVIPESARGRLQGLRRTVGESGAVMGPLVGGWLADAFSAGRAFLFYAPILLGAAAGLAFVARETLGRE